MEPEEPIMEQIRTLILHLKKYNVLDQLLKSISEDNKYPILDSQTLHQIILNGLKPHATGLNELDVESTSTCLINLLKLS